MKRLMRRQARVADGAAAFAPPRRSRGSAAEGHVPVYVGEEMERVEVRMDLLDRPEILDLLRRSASEYGYSQNVIRIPCPVTTFRRILHRLDGDGDCR